MSIPQRYIKNYFKRFADPKALMDAPLVKEVQMRVVIPCHNEPDLLGTLEALRACVQPKHPVEVLIVLNDSEQHAGTDVRQQNLKTLEAFKQWEKQNQKNAQLKFYVIQALNLPHKTAGVGLSRKIGMDEALRRFIATNTDGSIICLDADCRVSPNYLTAIEEEFQASDYGLGTIDFAHRKEDDDALALRQGIAYYERFLHYYIKGLSYAGFPYAIQTIGSCMLVKASVYAKHGGMNKRKAGEDFYFLHKIIPHEKHIEMQSAKVYPSCRVSDRVPFGTGKAQEKWLKQSHQHFYTYDPEVFKALKRLLSVSLLFYEKPFKQVIEHLPLWVQNFLEEAQAETKIAALIKNSTTAQQFHKQFFVWFDGFMCLKFVHFARDNAFPNIIIEEAEQRLAAF